MIKRMSRKIFLASLNPDIRSMITKPSRWTWAPHAPSRDEKHPSQEQ
jgi:hypothetical protein